jgi:hypothetical protein
MQCPKQVPSEEVQFLFDPCDGFIADPCRNHTAPKQCFTASGFVAFSAWPRARRGVARGKCVVSAKGCDMSTINFICLKTMRWSGWLLLPLVMAFLLTGYIMDGRHGFSKLLDEKTALMLHRMFHLPLIILVLAHVVPAVYLALQRWGWIKHRE